MSEIKEVNEIGKVLKSSHFLSRYHGSEKVAKAGELIVEVTFEDGDKDILIGTPKDNIMPDLQDVGWAYSAGSIMFYEGYWKDFFDRANLYDKISAEEWDKVRVNSFEDSRAKQSEVKEKVYKRMAEFYPDHYGEDAIRKEREREAMFAEQRRQAYEKYGGEFIIIDSVAYIRKIVDGKEVTEKYEKPNP